MITARSVPVASISRMNSSMEPSMADTLGRLPMLKMVSLVGSEEGAAFRKLKVFR